MKVYKIKYVEKEEIDYGLFGLGYEEHDGFLPELYISEEVARKHLPKDKKSCWNWNEKTYSIVEQEIVEE